MKLHLFQTKQNTHMLRNMHMMHMCRGKYHLCRNRIGAVVKIQK